METIGIVQASFGSPRFRGIASRRFGGRPLLEWVVRRVTDSTQLDGVIVVAGGNVESEILHDLVPPDVPIFVDAKSDPLDRFAHALERYPAASAVRIHGDSPFVDAELIDRLVTSAQWHGQCEYAGYCSEGSLPGAIAEWFTSDAIRRAARSARHLDDRMDVTRFLYTHPEKFTLRLLPLPDGMDGDAIRLTIDHEEDWENALEIFEALGPEAMDWQRIAELLDHSSAHSEWQR